MCPRLSALRLHHGTKVGRVYTGWCMGKLCFILSIFIIKDYGVTVCSGALSLYHTVGTLYFVLYVKWSDMPLGLIKKWINNKQHGLNGVSKSSVLNISLNQRDNIHSKT